MLPYPGRDALLGHTVRRDPGRRLGSCAVFVLSGSAATPWPEPGCRCVTCRAGPVPIGSSRLGLTVGGRRLDLSVAAGQAVERDGVRLVGLPGAPEAVTGTVVVGAGGRTLLWAGQPITQEALTASAGARLDGAVLDLRRPGGSDPIGLAHTLARLRAVQALAPSADVVVVGLDHDVRRDRLVPLLAAWGVRLGEPGTRVAASPAPDAAPPARTPWRTLVLGPASSGKSAHAEALLAAEPEVFYVATAPDPNCPPERGTDPEWARRIATHRTRRPPWWQTVEDGDPAHPGRQLLDLLGTPGAAVLLDSLGGWVTAMLGHCGAWDDDPGWSDRWQREVELMVGAWRASARQVVAVGEEAGWGVVPATASGRLFRDALGELTRRLAEQSERVELVVAGVAMTLGGAER